MHKYVEQLPDNQGWRCAGYDFRVDDDGFLRVGLSGVPGVAISSILEDGYVVNGVAHFVRDTAPTVRNPTIADPAPLLVNGDRWYKPSDGSHPGTAGHWIWKGIYWVSLQEFSILKTSANFTSATIANSDVIWGTTNSSILNHANGVNTAYLSKVILRTSLSGVGAVLNGSNKFDLNIVGTATGSHIYLLGTIDDITDIRKTLVSTDQYVVIFTPNVTVNVYAFEAWRFRAGNVVGSPILQTAGESISSTATVLYRMIHP